MPDPQPSPSHGAPRPPEAAFGGPVAGRLPRAATIGIVTALVVAVAVLAGSDLPTPGPEETATPPASVIAPSAAPSPEPSLLSIGTCDLMDPDGSFPAFRLSTAGFAAPASALIGRVQHAVVNTTPEQWLVPAPEHALGLATGANLSLRTADQSCIANVAADYAPVGVGTPRAGERTVLATHSFRPPSSIVLLDSLPEGEWVIHVIAHPFTSTVPAENTAYVELFFRVLVGPAPTPEPAEPAVTPALPCGIGDGEIPDATLIVPGAAPVIGERGITTWQETQPSELGEGQGPLVSVPAGAPVTLAIGGDRCALAWTIALAGEEFLYQGSNPTLDPAYAAQNRFELAFAGFFGRDNTLVATLTFPEGELVFRWHYVAAPIVMPDLRLVDAATGADAATLPGCPFDVETAGGWNGYTDCATTHPGVPLHELTTTAGAALRLEAEGWTITPQRADCGTFVAENEGQPELFVSDASCGSIPLYDDSPTVSLFAPPAGAWTLEFWLSLESEYVQLSAPWYVTVHVP